MVNAQEYINQNYPEEQRKNIAILSLESKDLGGNLDLSNFINLEELECSYNCLSSLDLTNCGKLEKIKCVSNELTNLTLPRCCPNLTTLYCKNNQLTNLNFSVLNPEKLLDLSIKNNNFSQSDLSIFSSFFNLEFLHIGNDEQHEEKINQNIYNRFHGSLESLKDLTRLQEIHISNTDVDSGIEHLPNSVEVIYCSSKERSESKVKRIVERLGKEDSSFILVDSKCISIKNNRSQKWLDSNYPKEKRAEAKELDIAWNDLKGGLDLSDFTNLKKLRCVGNELVWLNLSNCSQLEEVECNQNNLTNLEFLLTLPLNNQLTNLTIYHNPLTGSLAPLQNCPNLKILEIRDTNVNADLQYLPPSLEEIIGTRKINEELNLYGDNLIAWQEAHPELMKQGGGRSAINDLKILVATPEKLNEVLKDAKSDTGVTKFIPKLEYKEFVLRHPLPFSWEREENELSTTKNLPTRLYNIEKGKNKIDIKNRKELELDVEETKGREDNIKKYATMSYVCGLEKGKGEIYSNARKALNKVIKFLELINQGKEEKDKINYVWIDQLCIIQDGEEGVKDKKQEIPKMKQYYNDSKATLIAIDGEIGEKINRENECDLAEYIIRQIIASPWFTRSWCFQEGLLSKQTIFMFDDGVVDGRILASVWSGLKVVNHWINKLNKSIFATPLGWSYGASPDQTVNLRLTEALNAVKHRKQTVAADGLYALLGLLPYGSEITPNYKGKDCSCSEEEKKNCQHWPEYTKEDLNKAVFEIMEKEFKKGYSLEPIYWLGTRQNGKSWWAPEMNEDGSSAIEGLVNEGELKEWQLVNQGVKLVGDRGIGGSWQGEGGCVAAKVFNTQNNYFEIAVPQSEKATSPVVFTRKEIFTRSLKFPEPISLFIDMVDKEVIVGEDAIQEYQKIKEYFPNQQFTPLCKESGDWFDPRKSLTFDNFTIFQSQDKFYVWKNNLPQEIIRNSNDEWEYKSQELQAQIQVNTNQNK